MISSLQKRWKVSKTDLVLILCVFAITGTTTAYLSRSAPEWIGLTEEDHWAPKLLLRLVILIFGYQAVLLCVAFLLGQFPFFWRFEKRLLQHLRLMKKEKTTIPVKTANNPMEEINTMHLSQASPVKMAVFASGAGSNAQKLIEYFSDSPVARVSLVVCNKPGAGVLAIAEKAGIPYLVIEKERFFRGDAYLPQLQEAGIGFLVLAGFLWKVPQALIDAFPRRIVNIHPALLPKFGGKGMYGQYVHEAVLQAGERETGITVHFVDEHYDNGDIIFQTACPVLDGDTPETIAKRIHQLEHAHYPQVVEDVIRNIGQQHKKD